MKLHCRKFRVPKRDHTIDECEDALAFNEQAARFAIADGATESAHSGRWAQLLVDAFVEGHVAPGWPDWIIPLQQRWADEVKVPDSAALPWFLETRYRDGAFSTFLGLTISHDKWHALAVGDSCVFHTREKKLLKSFPIENPWDFDSKPALIGSRLPPDDELKSLGKWESHDWQKGDRLYLMTDALSHWFLTVAEAGGLPWLHLDFVASKNDQVFAEWIAQLRADRMLKNDDSTLMVVS